MSFLSDDGDGAMMWAPQRKAGLQRLTQFAPKAGRAYAGSRNFDFGPTKRGNISALSPWLRHRLVLEEEVLHATFAKHSYAAAEKFVQEVFWRGYFKGWLEHRPEVWQRYRTAVAEQVGQLEADTALADRYQAAVEGRTGIACFDAWAEELVTNGYLHNHARMWFASIWIYTLQLPWELGADFFYRHLLDGDPASNTCSWRWVGGLHSVGKTYLARADNIARYTNARFHPAGQLASAAPPLEEPPLAAPDLKLPADAVLAAGDYGLLVTEEDCAPESLPLPAHPKALLGLTDPTARSVLPLSPVVAKFAPQAVAEAVTRGGLHFRCETACDDRTDWGALLVEWAKAKGLRTIVVARPPIGPVARRLREASTALAAQDIALVTVMRAYDRTVWPHARKGFFALKKQIPAILTELQIAHS